ncbi:hypothetical protein [Beijerinckia indica]|uniref:hypothetical protein n=1 Tax=Beijerinckia indica TaxID=533 RepID=UPI0011D0AFE7|nr:hypothetical protein [Beijerinckia indica]
MTTIAVGAATIFLPAAGVGQPESAHNSGDCTILVQGNNNHVAVSGPCAPAKYVQVAEASISDQTPMPQAERSSLQFTVREFVFDPHSKIVYASVSVVNHSAEEAYLQIIPSLSSLELSDPPASLPNFEVHGLGTCVYSINFANQCPEHVSDINITTLAPEQQLGFRLIGHLTNPRENTATSSGSLNLVFLRKINNKSKYTRLDVSFMGVKLAESP